MSCKYMEIFQKIYLDIDLPHTSYIENLCKMTEEEILERQSPQIEWSGFKDIDLNLGAKENDLPAPSA